MVAWVFPLRHRFRCLKSSAQVTELKNGVAMAWGSLMMTRQGRWKVERCREVMEGECVCPNSLEENVG